MVSTSQIFDKFQSLSVSFCFLLVKKETGSGNHQSISSPKETGALVISRARSVYLIIRLLKTSESTIIFIFFTISLRAICLRLSALCNSPRTRYCKELLISSEEQSLSSHMFFNRSRWYLSAVPRRSDATFSARRITGRKPASQQLALSFCISNFTMS